MCAVRTKRKKRKLPPRTLLLVDDEPAWRYWVKMLIQLSEFNLVVIEAANGREALQILNATEVDLVLTDTNMAPVNGIELLKALKADYPKLPVVVFFSGLRQSNITKKELGRMGAAVVLSKDEALHTIPQVIRSVLEGL